MLHTKYVIFAPYGIDRMFLNFSYLLPWQPDIFLNKIERDHPIIILAKFVCDSVNGGV